MSSDLITFLRARLDEDEATAAEAVQATTGRWTVRETDWGGGTVVEDGCGALILPTTRTRGSAQYPHIVRHDPARVLREVEAKRRITELHSIVHRDIGWLEDGEEEGDEIPVCGLCVPKNSHYGRCEDVPAGPCLTLRHLALPYADHPDHRPEWRP